MIQTEENGKKTHLGPDLDPLGSKSSQKIIFQKPGFISQ